MCSFPLSCVILILWSITWHKQGLRYFWSENCQIITNLTRQRLINRQAIIGKHFTSDTFHCLKVWNRSPLLFLWKLSFCQCLSFKAIYYIAIDRQFKNISDFFNFFNFFNWRDEFCCFHPNNPWKLFCNSTGVCLLEWYQGFRLHRKWRKWNNLEQSRKIVQPPKTMVFSVEFDSVQLLL